MTVFFIIEILGLIIKCSKFAGRAELRSLRSLRYLAVASIFVIEIPSLPITFRSLPDDQSSARFARSASYRLTVFIIIRIPGLVIHSSNVDGRAELRSLRSLRYLSIDGIFHNRDTTPTYYFSIFAGRAELRSLRSLRYLSVDGILHNRDALPMY